MAMQRKKILWIDDEIEFLRSHIQFLETRGYSVTPVFSGDDGLFLIREDRERFDLVLVDEQMPGKDGIAVLTEIKEMLPELPVVMVTKSEEEELMEKAIGKKIDGYLTKPVNPSQILLVCKNLLQSTELVNEEARHAFVRSYSEIQLKLKKKLEYKEWVHLYRSLIKREFAIEDIDEESIRQGHTSQKNAANDLYANFVFSRYSEWLKGAEDKPLLSHEILAKFVKPAVNNKERFAFIVLDSIRLDQYVMIQRKIKKHFQVSNYFYSSILPTSREFALSSLLAGKMPRQIAEENPNLWEIVKSGGANILKELLYVGLQDTNLLKKDLNFYNLASSNITSDMISSNLKKVPFTSIYVDFLQMFGADKKQSQGMQEMVTSAKAFRNMTSTWFEESRLFEIIKRLSTEEVTVVLLPSSGNILCTQGTNYYGTESKLNNKRFRFGADITADERFGYFFDDPERFGLPGTTEDDHYVMLKENYHFTDHGTYEEYNELYKNSFERGGISMEEMILPLAMLKPKILDLDLDF